MITNISAWKISSLNEYSVQIRLGSNLGGFFWLFVNSWGGILRRPPHCCVKWDFNVLIENHILWHTNKTFSASLFVLFSV